MCVEVRCWEARPPFGAFLGLAQVLYAGYFQWSDEC